LRAANLQLLGSGQGSLTAAAIIAELPALAEQIGAGALLVDPVPVPLSDVESAWEVPVAPGGRIVFTTPSARGAPRMAPTRADAPFGDHRASPPPRGR